MQKNTIDDTHRMSKFKQRWSCSPCSNQKTSEKFKENLTPALRENYLVNVARFLSFGEVKKRKSEGLENGKKYRPLSPAKTVAFYDGHIGNIRVFPLYQDWLAENLFHQVLSPEISIDEDCETDEETLLQSKDYLISQITATLIGEMI